MPYVHKLRPRHGYAELTIPQAIASRTAFRAGGHVYIEVISDSEIRLIALGTTTEEAASNLRAALRRDRPTTTSTARLLRPDGPAGTR